MFEIGKKGTDKGQTTMTRDEQPKTHSTLADPPKRPASGVREVAVIGPSIRIDGDLRGEEDLLIEGEVKGTVTLKDNRLMIGSQGRVRANVYAHSIEVEGLMEGDLYGTERVNVHKSAQVKGNIVCPRVSVEDGARFKGTIDMDAESVEAALGAKRSSVASLGGGNRQQGQQGSKPEAVAAGGAKAEAS
jgi:cytoskeletal protein CcmA (bactofilin family)